MENLHLIEVIYFGPTNTKGSRIQLTSHRFKESIFLSYDYSADDIIEQAEVYLKKNGHKVVAHCETKKGYGILCKANADMLFKKLKSDILS